jgi:Fe2+ transport system protein FeoA
MGRVITCPSCGMQFDPGSTLACASCPLAHGCSIACCPACGWSTPDPERSSLVRLLTRRRRPASGTSLADVGVGARARIVDVDALPQRQREQRLAYGVAPGRTVEVLQTQPVTVMQVERTELALERTLSRAIVVAPA